MYDLPYHKETDEQAIRDFIAEHPFALLTGSGPDGAPVATQVPVFLDERDGRMFLGGHLMRGTDHHRAFEQNEDVLVVFTGPNVYVSGSWYSDPHIPSTWNYMSVHARGRIRFLDGDALVEVLRSTSLHFEQDDPESPTVFDNLPASLTDRLVKAIAAFEVEVDRLDNVFKLSQDRDEQSYRNIIRQLESGGESARAIAAEMAKRMSQVFPPGDEKDENP